MKYKHKPYIKKSRLRSLMSWVLVAILVIQLFPKGVLAQEDSLNMYTKSEADGYIEKQECPDAPAGKLFAGWYQDTQYETPYTGKEEAENVYAKYVDESVLGVKCQITSGTALQSDNTNLRLITTVDSLCYQQVGFDVTINEIMHSFASHKVYTSLKGYVGQNNSVYQPTVFSEESAYFMAYTLTKIPQGFFQKEIMVAPWWKTLDGTIVKGASRTVTINEIIGNDKTELLLAFDSYEEITGTGIRMGNQFGETTINQNETYRTEGNASWLVRPQGDYGEVDGYPYFWMQCLKDEYTAGFSTSDFRKYDKILMDIYNDSDEEVQLRWSFTMWNASEEYIDTDAAVWTLKPKAWTTCVYDLSEEAFQCVFQLESVKYMKVTFLTQKDNKEDTVPTLYLDNLRGHITEKEYVFTDFTYDMEEGLTFEKATDRYALTGNWEKPDISRIYYADEEIPWLKDSLGNYGLLVDGTGKAGPGVALEFGKTYQAGKMLSFMIYVKVDSTVAAGKEVAIQSWSGDTRDTLYQSTQNFNQWIEVKAILNADAQYGYFYVDFDENGISYLGDTPVKIYVDNIRISEADKEVIMKEDGSVVLKNPYWNKTELTYNVGQSATAGSTIRFDVEFNSDAKGGVWILGEGDWDKEFFAQYPVGGKQTITAEIQTDVTDVQIYITWFQQATEGTEYAVTISNLEIYRYKVEEGLSFERSGHMDAVTASWENPDINRVSYETAGITPAKESQGVYALQLDGTGKVWPGISVDYEKTFQKDMMLRFMTYIQVDPSATDGKWVRLESKSSGTKDEVKQSAWEFNQWVEVKIILSADATSSEFFINLDDGSGSLSWFGEEDVKIYLDNIRISEADKEVTENPDGSVTFRNAYWDKGDFTYNIQKSATIGSIVNFDIEFGGDAKGGVWVLGDGKWGDPYECFAESPISGKRTITATLGADAEFIQIYIGSFQQATDGSEYTVTISNIEVSPAINQTLSFETKDEMNRISSFNSCVYERVSYKTEGIQAPHASSGSYALKTKTGTLSAGDEWMKYYPGVYVDLEKQYEEGTKLDFWVYVKVKETSLQTQKVQIECHSDVSGSTWNNVEQSSDGFNEWIHVVVELQHPTKILTIFDNLDNDNILADDVQAIIYLDEIGIQK